VSAVGVIAEIATGTTGGGGAALSLELHAARIRTSRHREVAPALVPNHVSILVSNMVNPHLVDGVPQYAKGYRHSSADETRIGCGGR
jgi:hypothetical protein